jgi:hypothetical protein
MKTSPRSKTELFAPTIEPRSSSSKTDRRGSALIGALLVVVVVSAAVGVSFLGTGGAARMGNRATDYIEVQRAAEAAVEYGFGVWKQRVYGAGRPISTTEASAGLTGPAISGFEYASTANNGPLTISATDEYGAPVSTPKRVITNLPEYPGWRGFASSYLVSTKMRSAGQLGSAVEAGVRRRFQYVEVPLFQAMYFYEHDLEFYKPATMIVSGLVHSNSKLYASSSSVGTLTLTGNVSYVTGYSTTQDPPFANTWSGWSPNAQIMPTFPNGEANQVNKVQRYEPMGLSLATTFSKTDGNPNNDSYREIIEMPVTTSADPPEIAIRRLSNKAGIVMKINGTTATVTAQNGTTATATQLAQIRAAFTGKTTMFDQREGKNVDVANIDVSKITAALGAAGPTGFNGVLYVVDTTPVTTGGPSPSPNPKTIRLQKGGVLPADGLSIASQNPVYVQGDYNTGTTSSTPPTSVPANATGNPTNSHSPTVPGYTRKPAAIMADAVMLLSNSWNDANSSKTISNRVASNTTYNMAILAGFMPSGWQPPSGAQYGYSGGGNNFPRFLETWSGKSCTYYGSMVEIFESGVFTGKWDTGNIYSPPLRRWNFDTNFSTNPPPGGTDAALYTRGAWSKF